jgi:hypothetical protein
MTEASSSSKPAIQTSLSEVTKAAKDLLQALSDERAHHGGLITDKRIAAEGRLRLVLSRYTD